jgi:hypothetical protein
MHQIILSSEKLNSRILQEINDTKIEKLKFFDKIKAVNQINEKCIAIKIALERNEKN